MTEMIPKTKINAIFKIEPVSTSVATSVSASVSVLHSTSTTSQAT